MGSSPIGSTKKEQTMIVCMCNNVTDETIIKLVDAGHIMYRDIKRETGAGSTCGSCAPLIIQVIAARRNDGKPI